MTGAQRFASGEKNSGIYFLISVCRGVVSLEGSLTLIEFSLSFKWVIKAMIGNEGNEKFLSFRGCFYYCFIRCFVFIPIFIGLLRS